MIAANFIIYLIVASKLDVGLTKVDIASLKWGIFFACFSQACGILGVIAEWAFSDLDKEIKGE